MNYFLMFCKSTFLFNKMGQQLCQFNYLLNSIFLKYMFYCMVVVLGLNSPTSYISSMNKHLKLISWPEFATVSYFCL